MTTTAVIVTRPTPHVAQVAINRPEAKNAIDETTRLALIEAIEAALADDTVRALLLCWHQRCFLCRRRSRQHARHERGAGP